MPNVWMKHFALTYQSRMHEQRNNSVGKHMFLAEWLCISLYKRIPIRFHAKLYMGGYARQNTGVNTCPKQTPQFFLLNAFCPWGIVMDSILVRGRFGLFSQYIPIYSGSGISTYVIKSFIAAISRTRSQPRCIFQFLGSWRPLCPIHGRNQRISNVYGMSGIFETTNTWALFISSQRSKGNRIS